jgi:hypothetical protein
MKRLRRSKDRKSHKSRGNWRKTYDVFVEDNKMEVWTLLDRESQLYIAVDNKNADEAWNMLDGGSRLYALIHEARIRRELIL